MATFIYKNPRDPDRLLLSRAPILIDAGQGDLVRHLPYDLENVSSDGRVDDISKDHVKVALLRARDLFRRYANISNDLALNI
ncbi:MAG TPA: hypothetical protein VJB06_04060 [archaeon]|nr:hypothetical protein [archaeon]